MWQLVEGAILVSVAGALGGIANALLSDKGFKGIKRDTTADGQSILLPGWLGNCGVGLFAALLSWALYGPAAAIPIIGSSTRVPPSTITLATLAGAALVGLGGARWLSAEVDKKIQQGSAVALSGAKPAGEDVAKALREKSPRDSLGIVKEFLNPS